MWALSCPRARSPRSNWSASPSFPISTAPAKFASPSGKTCSSPNISDANLDAVKEAILQCGLDYRSIEPRQWRDRLHRQSLLQIFRDRHQEPCAGTDKISRGTRCSRSARQHSLHRLSPLVRPALRGRHRPPRREKKVASSAITFSSAADSEIARPSAGRFYRLCRSRD